MSRYHLKRPPEPLTLGLTPAFFTFCPRGWVTSWPPRTLQSPLPGDCWGICEVWGGGREDLTDLTPYPPSQTQRDLCAGSQETQVVPEYVFG